ncbi:OmpA family protein [Aquabacterium sp.]|uniref:OmpA family protein n=1 Tax=Aquabacterium sp. TaxID=1872578 RepID=UPI0025BF9524|nr:OmpA family protein [Aquabacterium sp.]
MSDTDTSSRAAFWLVGGVVAAVVVGVLAYSRHQAAPPSALAMAQLLESAPPGAGVPADPMSGAELILRKTLVDQVFFASGQTAVPPEGSEAIEAAVSVLGRHAEGSLVISGFHDASGSASTNAEVAKGRALAVREALLAAGVPPERIRFEKPQLTLDSGTPKQARRVDISLAE